MNDNADDSAHQENPARRDSPSEPGDRADDSGFAELESDFARYFLSLPDSPLAEDATPEPTFEDLIEEAETIHGADQVAARARSEEPGPATALMLDAISRRRLSAAGLLDAACAAERLASWTQAAQHRYLAAFSRPGVCASAENLTDYASAPGQPLHEKTAVPANDGSGSAHSSPGWQAEGDLGSSGSRVHGDPATPIDPTSDALCLAAFKVAAAEVSAALRVSPISANRRVSQAVDFADELPATLMALQRGVIDRGRSLVIADRTQNLPTDLRRRVESIVVLKAATRNAGQLRGIVDRAVIAADPAAAKKRQEAARRNRGVSLRAGEDGMSVFRADLPADKACTAFTVLDQIALMGSRRAGENRPINAIRSDAFADIFDQLADHGSVHLHTILGKGHTNVDPRQPCPEHSEPAQPTTCSETEQSADEKWAEAQGAGVPNVSQGAGDDVTGLALAVPACDDITVLIAAVPTAGSATGDESTQIEAEDHRDDRPREPEHREAERTSAGLGTRVLATTAARQVSGTGVPNCGCYEPTSTPVAAPVWGLGTHQGRATGLNVTIAATTLAGLDDLPGELDRHGTIPADLARALAASAATITAIAVNPACGTALDLGRTVYRPRQAQRDYVNQRDQTCRFPSCRQPAWRCQLDHSNEFCPGKQDSGVTCPCNLACLCKFHHDLKTFGLWDTEHHSDDSITFTSPTGRTYTTHPREWLTARTESVTARTDVGINGTVGYAAAIASEHAMAENDDPPF